MTFEDLRPSMNLIPNRSRRMIVLMRRALLRWGVLVAVGLMLCGHVTELFDHWDHTLTTGGDIDYSVVLLAASAGLAVVVARHLISLLSRSKQEQTSIIDDHLSVCPISLSAASDTGLSPPPLLLLRI